MAGDETSSQSQAEKNAANDARKEELAKQIRTRVASEERAYRIVESLVDVTVSIGRLKDMAHFILPAHYKDITEERAIAKLCGFPVCERPLGKVTRQKYQISTKTNKVYDITESKNFCSSKCYKSSKIFEKQILESPLWSRESEKPADFLLPKTKTGWLGVEVIGKSDLSEDEAEDDVKKTEASSILESRNWINELQEHLLAEKPQVFKEPEEEDPIIENLVNPEADPTDAPIEDENQGFNLLDVSDFLKEQLVDDDAVSDVSERLSTVFDSDDDPDPLDEPVSMPQRNQKSKCPQVDHLAKGLSKVSISKDENQEKSENSSASKMDYYKKLFNSQKKGLCVFIDDVPTGSGVEPPHPAEDSTENIPSQSNPVTAANSQIPESTPSTSSESQNIPALNQWRIQNKLQSWITEETLEYLGITTEESGNADEIPATALMNQDFAKLCDRVDMRGLEFDELLDERIPQTVYSNKKGLPSYGDLQKETANFSVKVKEYFKPPPKKKEEKVDDSAPVYVFPLVDSRSQITLRKNIVLQQLGKRMNSILSPMNILLGEISHEISELISTFNLQSDTIVFKPAEWNVVGIFLIFMLSKKVKKLDDALQATRVQEKFTESLNKFDMNFQDAKQFLEDEILVL